MGIVAVVLSGFALALVAPWIFRTAQGASGWLLAALPFGLAAYLLSHLPAIGAGEAVQSGIEWAPSLSIELTFRLDGLSLLLALLISGTGGLVLIYAGGYLAGHPHLGRLYAFLLMFMASMLGLVLADNVLVLFVFWELTSISSYLLIGFDHERAEARAAALQALLVTGGGGLALLAGLVVLGQVGGSFELSALAGRADEIRADALYVPVVVLILLGAFTKSAQFPFHFWLPAAMEAPTPVSAYLHSATMVKAGVYLIARLSPTLGGTETWFWLVTSAGAATMLLGGLLALVQSDLKRILAYSTVSALGLLSLLLGMGTDLAVGAAMAYLVAHALYKGALFLVAGTLDHEAGTRNVDQLGGLARWMPITAAAAMLAALSMAGLPPLFGFIGKEIVNEAVLDAPYAAYVATVAVIASAMFVAIAVVAGIGPFFGRQLPTPRRAHEASVSLWLGSLSLAVLGLALAVWPQIGIEQLVSAASAAVLQRPTEADLAMWHGFTPALGLSGLAVVGGIVIYAARSFINKAASVARPFAPWGPAGWYDLSLNGLNALAAGQTRLLQSGYLRYYLLITLATLIGLTTWKLADRGNLPDLPDWSSVRFYEAGPVALILLAALTTVVVQSRLFAIAALGVVGYGVALVFVLFGAPDLAMTQFLVETLTVILFVLVFYHLPESSIVSGLPARGRDAVVALAVGGVMTTFVLFATTTQFEPAISHYHLDHSVIEAHGRNVVNVILVDFRALDTLGEITVLAIAGIGVHALLKLRLAAGHSESANGRPHSIADEARQGDLQ